MAETDLDKVQEVIATNAVYEDEALCWGCGLRLLLSSDAAVFKCGWCGAITDKHKNKAETKSLFWRRLRDRCFVAILLLFMLFVICGGMWAVYPVVFSLNYTCGLVHSFVAVILSVSTLSSFGLAAFRCAGRPPNVLWGSYPVVGKGDLENYTFCQYCSKPKSPSTHHCRSCGMCILDMDHHCPFIGNCVGAANHRQFVVFLFSAIISMSYVSIICLYSGFYMWPPLKYGSIGRLNGVVGMEVAKRALKEVVVAVVNSAVFMSARGLVVLYLFFASISVNIGLSVLLWQQLSYIYQGRSYLTHLQLQSQEGGGGFKERDCGNIFRFLGCPYALLRYFQNIPNSRKRHKK